MELETLRSPVSFLQHMLGALPHERALREYESWWETEGRHISDATDRAGTPWLRMFDRGGRRVDEILFAPEYWRCLRQGYKAGVVWRAFEDQSLSASALLDYITCFYDPGLTCPYVISLATAVALAQHGSQDLQARFLPLLLRRDDTVWQGATWMTEIRGGSDLGANVETVARRADDRWLLTGDKYFASNAGADLAVVAARPEGAPNGVRGLALFLLPKRREDGALNYTIRRLKDKVATRSVPTGEVELRTSEAWLLGSADRGVHLILEVLNLSRATNALGSMAIAQRAIAEAADFTRQRIAFGKPVFDHPMMRKQFEERIETLQDGFALGWESIERLNEVWRQKPPYSDRYHLFRLVAHLAKYWTSDLAPQIARWAMETHGALGVLAEFPVERWFREAMVLTIWEGTCHRQILDGLEVMERKGAHHLLFERLREAADPLDLAQMRRRVEAHLELPQAQREAGAEEMFRDLAIFTARTVRHAAVPAGV
ncbi:MAG TPA: acyl-CoA dehydrogenase family protein [Bryobacteraceae bacterium]|nr:acyl-CoA dehydrogenase family protein [Bryobacteraceae bacterium]